MGDSGLEEDGKPPSAYEYVGGDDVDDVCCISAWCILWLVYSSAVNGEKAASCSQLDADPRSSCDGRGK